MTDNHPLNDQQVSLLNFLNILFKRKSIILSFFFSVVLVVTVGSFLLPPVYEANSKLLLEREAESEASLLFRMNLAQRYEREDWINSEIEILNSYPVAEKVVKAFNLHLEEVTDTTLSETEEKEILDLTILGFQKKLKIENTKNSNVIIVSFEGKDPEKVAKIVNNVVQTYITYRSNISDESQTYEFFEEQIKVADEKLRQMEQRQSHYKQQEQVLPPEAQQEILMDKLADYEKRLTEVRTKRIGKEAKLTVIKEQLLKGIDIDIPTTESSDSPSREKYIAQLKGELLLMEIERERLLQKFTPKYEEVVNLNKQIEATEEKIRSEIRQIIDMEEASIRALWAEEQELQNAITAIRADIKDQAQKEYEYAQITRGIDDSKEVYSMLLKQREEARISLAKLERGVKIKIISPAVVPTIPVKPRKKLNVAMSIVLGIFGGLGLAFFIEYFDHSLNNPGDFERYTGLPVLGSVREFKSGQNA